MLKNYFRIAWRNMFKSKMHSFINIAGLSMGMAVAVLVGLWIYDEISYDQQFDNRGRIAQVMQHVSNNGQVQTWDNVPYPLADELRKNYGSNFKYIAMAVQWGDHLLSFNNKILKKNGVYFEKDGPEILALDMLQGTRQFTDVASVLLSASTAKAYFGNENPVNRLMKIDEMPAVKVIGVFKDFPLNSHFASLNFISTWDLYYNNNEVIKNTEDPWRPNFTSLFVQLNDLADFDKVSANIKDAKLKKVNPELAKKKPALFLQPMDKWHLYSEFKNGVNTGGAIQYVWMFGIIGIFVLLLACINFMNLSTARSEKRAKEVGIRKTLGSSRKQLIAQFFTESLMTVLFSFALSLVLVLLMLPFFNQVAGKQLNILWDAPVFWLIALAFILFTALIAGSYPALYLSSFNPLKVLKGTFKAGRYATIPRKILVVFQFSVSVILIIGTTIVYKQILFAKDRPVGYSRNNLVTIPTPTEAIHKHFDVVRDELIQKGAIVSMSESESPTTGIWNTTSGFSWKDKDPNQSIDFAVVNASFDYGKTIGWKIKEGRDFSKEFKTDSSALILNEAAVKFMGLKNPVGETVSWWGHQYNIIAVVENILITSPYNEPGPVIYNLSTEAGIMAIVKLNSLVSVKDALSKVEPVFKKYNTQIPFEYHFVDDDYAKKFGDEERIGKLAGFFAILAIVISCLGLFGLASFVAEQRSKEISVRKVLGATVFNVWNLLSKDFLVLVIISFLLSFPIAYYFTHSWLQDYAYHTSISWWIFALAGAGCLAITVIVVSFQAIKAALVNPVKRLRSE